MTALRASSLLSGGRRHHRHRSAASGMGCCVFVVSHLVVVFNLLLLPSVAGRDSAPPTVKCMLGNDTTCPAHHCCVKKVITFRDPNREPLVGTECQPLLTEGAMCLRTPEDYVCTCLPGMRCDMATFDTMGYCRSHAAARIRTL